MMFAQILKKLQFALNIRVTMNAIFSNPTKWSIYFNYLLIVSMISIKSLIDENWIPFNWNLLTTFDHTQKGNKLGNNKSEHKSLNELVPLFRWSENKYTLGVNYSYQSYGILSFQRRGTTSGRKFHNFSKYQIMIETPFLMIQNVH